MNYQNIRADYILQTGLESKGISTDPAYLEANGFSILEKLYSKAVMTKYVGYRSFLEAAKAKVAHKVVVIQTGSESNVLEDAPGNKDSDYS